MKKTGILIDLTGRRALVTAGSRGIGAAICEALAESGASVAVNYARNKDAAELVVKKCRRFGTRAVAIGGDAADADDAAWMVKESATKLGGEIDLLVSNYGPFHFGPMQTVLPEKFESIIRQNLFSTYALIYAALPKMVQMRYGTIICVGLSCACDSVDAAPNIGPYGVAKTALASLTKSLAAELAEKGIRIMMVAPGLIDNGHLSRTQKKWMRLRAPGGRLGTPREVANVVAFLSSSLGSYCSGATVQVAGGWRWGEDRSTAFDFPKVAHHFSATDNRSKS